MKDFNVNAFNLYDKQWALVTAGSIDDYNTMTISWGGVGTIWNKPVATVYVKPIRHTYNYLENSEYFTVSFYSDEYKKDLGILGSKSGRDTDKVALTKLTAKEVENSVTFEQAEITLLCRKIYWQDLVTENMPQDVIDKYYVTEEPHRMYIGEVVGIV
ncbi:MAG: hypothetical protein E7218_03705 [Anaerofustis stercorihominis]|nr:hypothetical protein [Anaerofustis stercorihominis]